MTVQHGMIGLVVSLIAAAAGGAETNLVANGSFEQLDGAGPAAWAAAGDEGVKQTLTADAGKVGRRAAKLHCSAYSRRSPASHAMLAQVGKVALKKGQMYRFSCWARAEGLRSRQVQVAISNTKVWGSCGLQAGIVVGRSWRRFETYFTATQTIREAGRLQIWFAETGTLWLDAVEIVPVAGMRLEYTDRIAPAGGKNLLPNGSFECGRVGWASLGKPAGWGNMSGLYGQVEKRQARHGDYCLRIEIAPGKTPVTYFDYFQPVRVEQRSPLAANVGWVRVEKGSRYTLSAWMRADRERVPARMFVRHCDPGDWRRDESRSVVLSTEWRRFDFTVTAQRRYLYVAVGPDLADSKLPAATVWLDAVQLEPGRRATDFAARQDVEIDLATEPFGNVFAAGEPVRLIVGGRNETAAAAAAELTATAEDFFGAKTPLGKHRLALPAGATVRADWPLPLKDTGWYRLHVTWQADGRKQARSIRLAIIRPYAPADSPFGLNHAPPTAELCTLLRRAGIVWARDWSLKWQHVEPEPGKFDPSVADVQIDRVLAAGMKQVCLLPPFPSSNWASEAPASVATAGYPGNRLRMAYAPKDPALLAKFIERCARHLRGRVAVWDFLNEPIYTNYSLPAAGKGAPGAAYTAADYVRLLKLAYAAMKRADPNCRVLGGIGSGPDNLTRELAAAGGLDHLDILNLHTYPGRARPEGYLKPMADLLARMKKHGKVKPIWYTEYSYYATDDLPWKPFIRKQRSWAADRLLADERQCADYSVRFAVVMLARGVEKVFYHSGASGEVNRQPLECCLLAYAGRPRKVYAAQAALANVLGPDVRFAARLAPAAGAPPAGEGLYGFAFQCGKRSVVVAWADVDAADAGPWQIKTTAQAQLYDIVGRRLPGAAATLSASPVYVVSTTAGADELARSCRFVRAAK